MNAAPAEQFIPCTARFEPHSADGWLAAAERACQINPANAPPVMMGLMRDAAPTREHLAVVTTKKWGAGGVNLTVGFRDNPSTELRNKILLHMNAWGQYANVKFVWSTVDQQVRIAFGNSGYWSYLGTDILGIPKNEPTMNLQGFTINTPDREFYRVVRHETGHTLGFPHEHARRDIVSRLDPQKTIAYFKQTQGWNEATIRQQILTPLSEASITGTTEAEETSIMTYSFPASITKDGKPIPGGDDITPMDGAFVAKMYPKSVQPPPVANVMQVKITDPDSGEVFEGTIPRTSVAPVGGDDDLQPHIDELNEAARANDWPKFSEGLNRISGRVRGKAITQGQKDLLVAALRSAAALIQPPWNVVASLAVEGIIGLIQVTG